MKKSVALNVLSHIFKTGGNEYDRSGDWGVEKHDIRIPLIEP